MEVGKFLVEEHTIHMVANTFLKAENKYHVKRGSFLILMQADIDLRPGYIKIILKFNQLFYPLFMYIYFILF